jgi:hypothetical protein
MKILRWIICLAYWTLLTVLLLSQNPAEMVGLEKVPWFSWGKTGLHTTSFVILGVLAHAARWPKRVAWQLIAILAVYAVTTETLQVFVPNRHAWVPDGLENLAGVAIGTFFYWLAWQWFVGNKLPIAANAQALDSD